jgi:hypothetical protein
MTCKKCGKEYVLWYRGGTLDFRHDCNGIESHLILTEKRYQDTMTGPYGMKIPPTQERLLRG